VFDLVFKGGEVFDGSGASGYIGDVAIKDGKIAAVSSASDIDLTTAAEVIDVTGLSVAPGFVDMHTHSDFTLIADGRAESQVHPGASGCNHRGHWSMRYFLRTSCYS